MSPYLQEKLLHFMRAIGEGRHEDAANLAIGIGETREKFDIERFRQGIAHLTDELNVQQIEVGTAIMKFAQIAGDSGLRLLSELTMLAKTLMNLDEVARTLNPRI